MDFKRIASRLTAGVLLAGTLVTPALAATGTVNTEGSYLHLRTEANTDSSILKNLPHSTKVEILSALDNGWYQVSFDGITGYVSGSYLTVTEEDTQISDNAVPAADASESEKIYIKVTEGPLNIRSGPGTEYDRVGSLYAGRVMEVTEILTGWYKIKSGYISADYALQIDAAEAQAAATKGQEIADYALQFVGYPYVHGGSSPKGFDCSGFTSYVYKQFGYSINRTCSGQLDNGTPVSINDLQPGDIVIFNKGNASTRATHVGLYIGNNQFVHASTPTKGVIINKMSDYYYTTGFVGARRIVD